METDIALEAGIDTPADTPDAGVEAAEPLSTPIAEPGETPAGDSPDAWNGELESLEAQPWWAEVPENHRDALTQGLKAKYANWNKGYTQKLQDVAEQRKAVEAEHAAAKIAMQKAKRFIYGDIDPLAEKDQEIEGLKTKLETIEAGHQAALRTLQEENTRQLREAAAQGESALSAVRAEATAARARLDAIQAAETAKQEAVITQQQQQLTARIETEAPDLMENDAAFFAFASGLRQGYTFEEALKMTRALHPGPSQPEAANPAEDLMSVGGAGPGPQGGKAETLEQILRRNKEAEGGIWRVGQ